MNLNQIFMKSMLMIYLYILKHLNLPNRFANLCPLKIRKNFIVEHKNIGAPLFLDVKICRKNGKFVTSVYEKPRVFISYESFIPLYQKRVLLHT